MKLFPIYFSSKRFLLYVFKFRIIFHLLFVHNVFSRIFFNPENIFLYCLSIKYILYFLIHKMLFHTFLLIQKILSYILLIHIFFLFCFIQKAIYCLLFIQKIFLIFFLIRKICFLHFLLIQKILSFLYF